MHRAHPPRTLLVMVCYALYFSDTAVRLHLTSGRRENQISIHHDSEGVNTPQEYLLAATL